METLHTNITDLQNVTTFERVRVNQILDDNRKAFSEVLGKSYIFTYLSLHWVFLPFCHEAIT